MNDLSRPTTLQQSKGSDSDDPPRRTIAERMIEELMYFAAVYAVTALGIAEHLGEKELSVDALAERCDAQPHLLQRLLRAAQAKNLVRMDHPGRYTLTALGRTLRHDHDDSLRQLVMTFADPAVWSALQGLPATIRTGRPAAVPSGSTPGRPQGDLPPHALLNATADVHASSIAAALAQHGLTEANVIVDAGGSAAVLAKLPSAPPRCTGTQAQHPATINDPTNLAAHQPSEQKIVYSDTSAHIPPGGDVYLMINALHRLDDVAAWRTVFAVRDAMAGTGSHAELWCVQQMLPPIDRSRNRYLHPGIAWDLQLLSSGEGRMRTLGECIDLFGSANLSLQRKIILPHGEHLLVLRTLSPGGPPSP
ncbi:methyltransferase [Streptosporangium canum]|uniref:methyltransferase family protein n=1 Tax=Streptosporangium canum TaxID=324952 RepID=UPI0036B4318B